MYLVWNYLHEWNGRTLKFLFADQWHTFCVETEYYLSIFVLANHMMRNPFHWPAQPQE